MMKIKIKYLPQARWQLILDSDASPAVNLDQPIIFGNHFALSSYYGEEFIAKIQEVIPKVIIEIVDESWPPEMNEDNPNKER